MPTRATHAIPTCLLVPDIGGMKPRHWLSLWQSRHDNCHPIDAGDWADPVRSSWLSRIDYSVGLVRPPAILVAHGLGALAVAWWAALLGKRAADRVAGALLVAPPDPELPGVDERIGRFGPLPTAMLPFPSILVASENDPYVSLDRAREMAGEWICDFVNAGPVGHFGPDAGLGLWPEGERLLDILVSGGPGLSRYTYRPEPPTRGSSGHRQRITPRASLRAGL